MSLTIINQKKIGSGSYGDVYVVKNEEGEKFAVKIVSSKKLSVLELDIITRLNSPYLLRSVGDPVVQIQHSHGISLQLKENTVGKLDTRKLPYYQLKRIMICCLFGLRCMHSKGFLHNDLVLRNLLFDRDENNDYNGYIADFSVSVKCIDAEKGISVKRIVKGTHTPIEILEGLKKKEKTFRYNSKTDVWSLGLCFLEMIDKRFHFSGMNEQFEFFDSLSEDYIRSKVKLYNRDRKINKKEELYLSELLIHMLKKNKEDRMSTKDLMYLNFVRTSSISYECAINKPSELITIPTSSDRLREGIEKIREYFDRYEMTSLLSSYFLTIQNYIRIMNKIVIEGNDDFDLDEIVEIAISTSSNYYDRKIEAGYEGVILLRGEVGYNPFFYAANFIEELVLLDHYIDQGDNFSSIFSFLNPFDIFYQFRLMYDYGDENKVTNRITYELFKSISLPDPKEKREPKIYYPNDYTNIVSVEGERGGSLIRREKEIEEIFNGVLVEHIKKTVRDNYTSESDDIYELAKKYINGGSEIRKTDVYKGIREKDIFSQLMGVNEFFDYGLIMVNEKEIFNNIFPEKKFIIVDKENIISLLHVDDDEMVVTHYYSEKNRIINSFYEERGYQYQVNFEYGVNSCCKVIDSCILFIVFYNNYLGKESFNMKCISEETNFLIFLSLFV